MRNFIKAFGNKLLKCEQFIVAVCCVVMVLLVFVTVVMRYLFEKSFQGMEELIMLFAFCIYFIGGALATRDEGQVTADMMSLFIKKERTMLGLKAIRNAIDGVLLGILTVFSTQQMLFVLGQGSRTSALKLPVWIIYTIILVGLALMTVYALCHVVEYTYKCINFKKTYGEGEGESK